MARVVVRIGTLVELGNSDVVFKAHDDDALIGTLMVSRGGLEWRSARRQYVEFVTWERFDEIASSFPRARRKPTTSTRRRLRTVAAAPVRGKRTSRRTAAPKARRRRS